MECLKCTGQVSREVVSHEALARESGNSLCKILEEMEISFLIFVVRLQDSFFCDLLAKMPLDEFFSKIDLAFWKKSQNTSGTQKHFQKQIKYSKIFLGLIIKKLSIHKSHLNMYNQTNEIVIH